jgi:hypothetical protein
MAKHPREFQITVRAFTAIRVLVFFATNRVHQGVRSNRVNVVTVSAVPGGRYPFSFPIDGFILVQPHCFGATLWTFLFYE